MILQTSRALTGLVGDIGGTNARFAIATVDGDETHLDHCHALSCASHSNFYDVLDAYFDHFPERPSFDFAILAVAGPVRDGQIRFTNLDWAVSEGELRKATGAPVVRLINDYAALAYGLPHLRDRDYHTIGAADGGHGRVYAVMGAGTGFGASVLIESDHGPVCLPTESGHLSFAPVGDLELEVDKALRRRFGRVTIEHILSGNGLVNLYRALAEVRGEAPRDLTPAQITACDGSEGCRQTVDTYWDVMASVAGDFVLSHGATAGVFIAGGVSPRVMKYLDEARFRRRMEDKPPMSALVQGVPCRLITHEWPALVGAANALSQQEVLAIRPDLAAVAHVANAPPTYDSYLRRDA